MNGKPNAQLILSTVLTVAIVLTVMSAVVAAPKANLWSRWQKHDPASTQKIDHSAWDRFLKRYVVASHPSGINRVRYGAVAPEDRAALKSYLKKLQSIPISNYNRSEQKAYWINLYNALTVEVILSRLSRNRAAIVSSRGH
jgi:hypothetical protein